MKKIVKSQLIRHFMQIVMFITLPGLYILSFSEIKTLAGSVAHGTFTLSAALSGMTALIATGVVTALTGRFFCGWMCSFGTFVEAVDKVLSKFIKRPKMTEQADRYLKKLKYIILGVLILTSAVLGIQMPENSSPWDVFAQLTTWPFALVPVSLGLVLLGGIVVGSAVIERFFCRYLCPMGATFALMSKAAPVNIRKPTSNCGSCMACSKQCAMGLPLYKMERVRGGECIQCMKCVAVCPKGNAKLCVADQPLDASFAGALAVGAVLAANAVLPVLTPVVQTVNAQNSVQTVTQTNTATGSASASSAVNVSGYKDGTYTGSATGYHGGTTTVSVTVKSGVITAIKTVSTQDTPNFYQRVESTVINSIIQKQSTKVDTISGATYSCKGIANAVASALAKAV